MAKFTEQGIWELHEKSLRKAEKNLRNIQVFCGSEPYFKGLSGWVFEKTIQFCILQELGAKRTDVEEQVSLGGKVKADLKIGRIAIEIKAGGLFDKDDVLKYKKYQGMAGKCGLEYLFISSGETVLANRQGIIKALGKANVFFLCDESDEWNKGEWERFVSRLVALLEDCR